MSRSSPASASAITDEMVKAGAAAMCCQADTLGCAAKNNDSEFTTCMLSTFMLDAKRCLEAARAPQAAAGEPATKSAPVQRPSHNNGERLPSGDAAGVGADTAGALPPVDEVARIMWEGDHEGSWSEPHDGQDVSKIIYSENASVALEFIREWQFRHLAQGALEPLRALAGLFSESAHEAWTKDEIVNIIEDAIRLGSTHPSTTLCTPALPDNPARTPEWLAGQKRIHDMSVPAHAVKEMHKGGEP